MWAVLLDSRPAQAEGMPAGHVDAENVQDGGADFRVQAATDEHHQLQAQLTVPSIPEAAPCCANLNEPQEAVRSAPRRHSAVRTASCRAQHAPGRVHATQGAAGGTAHCAIVCARRV